MKSILVDTDILIDYSKGYDRFLGDFLSQQTKGIIELFICTVTIAEFMTNNSLSDSVRREKAMAFLDLFTVKHIGKAIGYLAGTYLREQMTDYLGDALIAAVAVDGNMELATRNVRDFRKIPGLVLLKI